MAYLVNSEATRDEYNEYAGTFLTYTNVNSMETIRRCEILNDCKESPEVFCKQCDKMLCKDCTKYHWSFHKDHDIESLPDSTFSQLTYSNAAESTVVCEHYSKKPMDLFCTCCQMLICKECSNGEHSGHQALRLDMAAAETEEVYKQVLEGCKAKYETSTTNVEELEKKLRFHEENVKSSIDQFSQFVEDLKTELDRKKSEAIEEFEVECDRVKGHIQTQMEFCLRQQEAEKHLEMLINMFDKKESRMHWLALRKPFTSIWKLIENQQIPRFEYPGVAIFAPNEKIRLCIKEMSIGSLLISPDIKTEPSVSCNDFGTARTTGPSEEERTIGSSYLDTEGPPDLKSEVDTETASAHDQRSDSPVFGGATPNEHYRTVVDIGGNNVTFNPHTKTLHVRLLDKEKRGDKKKKNTSHSEQADFTPYLDDIYEQMPEVPSLPTHPLLPPPSFVNADELSKSRSMNDLLDLAPYNDDRPTTPPPVPPRRRKKTTTSRPVTPETAPGTGAAAAIAPEGNNTRSHNTKKTRNGFFHDTMNLIRRSSII